jgi:hypothetical protein
MHCTIGHPLWHHRTRAHSAEKKAGSHKQHRHHIYHESHLLRSLPLEPPFKPSQQSRSHPPKKANNDNVSTPLTFSKHTLTLSNALAPPTLPRVPLLALCSPPRASHHHWLSQKNKLPFSFLFFFCFAPATPFVRHHQQQISFKAGPGTKLVSLSPRASPCSQPPPRPLPLHRLPAAQPRAIVAITIPPAFL